MHSNTCVSDQRASKPRLRRVLVAVACWSVVAVLWASPAGATVTRYEAEDTGSACSTSTSIGGYSGTGYKLCSTPNTVTFSFTIATGEDGTASLYLSRSASARVAGITLDGGTRETVSYSGAVAWINAYTTPTLAAGAHTIVVDRDAASATSIAVDYIDVTTSAVTTTTTEATTTTTEATTTTTAAPTTTTLAEGESLVVARPDNATKQALAVLVLLATSYWIVKVGRS